MLGVDTLRVLEKQRRIVKNGVGKGVTWGLTAAAEESAFQAEVSSIQTKEFFLSIPALIKPQGELNVPTLAQITPEIRKAKTKLNRLEKLRGTIFELGKHKKIIQQLQGNSMKNENELTALALTIEKCQEIVGCPAGVDLQDRIKQLRGEWGA
ncbi:TPA: hypothetical protein ACIJVJ_002249 [Raoultella planticola]